MSLNNTILSYEQIDTIFEKSRTVFFIGIGGISMSSLAKYCYFLGKNVFGYDSQRSELCDELEKYCHIKYCSTPDSVEGMDLIIYTTAIDESNYEYLNGKRLRIPLISRANFLGYVMSKYNNQVGISGTHGKSTTCAMVGHIFNQAALEPTVFCGAVMKNFNSNSVIGKNDYFVFEACEYKDAFLSFCPREAAITNIEYDHPDFFKNKNQLVCSFQKFANLSKKVYINSDDSLSKMIIHPNIVTFGIENEADYTGKIVHVDKENEFFVYKKGEMLGKCKLNLFGKHFVYDALCAFAIAYENKIPVCTIIYALSSFCGTKRRMELLGKTSTGVDVFEDYAHHPTEISASLASLRHMGYKNILCIYQPHTYSRSHYLYESFKNAFSLADTLVFAPTYTAREENIFGFSDSSFAMDCGGVFIEDLKKIADYVSICPCDCIVIMGAGSIDKIKGLIL